MPLGYHKRIKFKTKGMMFPLHNPLMKPKFIQNILYWPTTSM